MQISVAMELYGSYDPVETPKPLWGSPGAELSTWTTFQFCCETAIHGHALRHGPPELYSAIQRYTLYNLYNTPLSLARRAPLPLTQGESPASCARQRGLNPVAPMLQREPPKSAAKPNTY